MKITILVILTMIMTQYGICQDRKPEQKRELYQNGIYDPYKVLDTRIDNMGYWRKAAELGLAPVAPFVDVPLGEFRGSKIEAKSVWREDSPDVPVTSQNSTQSENSVFVDPNNPNHVLQSNNSTQNPVGSLYGANYFFSYDYGETWGGSISGAGGNNSGDPATAIGLNGRQFVGFINSSGGQGVSYSDNGTTWTQVQAGTPPGGSDILDKNHLWIDNSPTSLYQGYIYNAWTGFGNANDAEIEFVRSTNNGLSYSSHLNISSAVNAGSHNQGVNLSTGPNGEVYACWAIYDSWPSNETAIGFAKSLNGGATFSIASRIISNIKGIRNSGTSKNMRVNSFPSMTTDISNSPFRGNLYIVWTNIGVPGTNTGTDRNVYIIRSSNQGSSWSVPVKVNQDAYGLGKQHYFPWITCDPETGTLSVIFYDDRNVGSTQCEVWCANSYDGGNTWEDFRVSDVSFTPSPIPGLASSYMGDYLGISARDGKVYPVWTDTRTGTVMTYTSPYLTNNLTRPSDLSTSVTFETGQVLLNWSFTPVPGFDYFVIYRDEIQIGTSATTQFTDLLPDYGIFEYEVTAMHEEGESSGVKATVQWGDAQISVNPEAILQSLPVNSSATRYLTLTNNGQIDLNFKLTSLVGVVKGKDYCTASTSVQDEYIANVLFGSINNSSGWQNSVANYTNLSTSIFVGNTQSITVTNGNDWAADKVYVWVDWNNDYVFGQGTSEEFPLTNVGGNGQTFSGTITVPNGTTAGNHRMRIRMTYISTPSPCGSATYGEIEDYTLKVIGWFIVENLADTIPPENSQTVNVSFSSQGISQGTYSGNIKIESNDPDNAVLNVPVILNVGPLTTLQVNVTANPPQIDIGESSVLSASPIGGSNNYSYSWTSDPPGFTSQQSNPWVSPEMNTIYYVTVNDGFSSASGQVTVEVISSITQSLSLSEGWNLMSFRVTPENTNMLNVVDPLISQGVLYKVINETGSNIFHLPFPPPNGQWSNTIGDLQTTEGYYIKTLADASLPLTGTRVPLPLEIPLYEGWNMISYPCEMPQNALDAVQPLIDQGILYKVIDESGGIVFHLPFPPPNGAWTNTIGNFESGKGYYVKVTGDCSLSLDNPSEKSNKTTSGKIQRQTSYFSPGYSNNPFMPMAIIIQPEEWMEPGDELGVFDGNLCVGTAVYQGISDQAIIIPVTMDDAETPSIDGAVQDHNFKLNCWKLNDQQLWDELSFTIMEGNSSFQPLGTSVLDLNLSVTQVASLDKGFDLAVIPNPFNEMAALRIKIVQPMTVSAEIYSSTGQQKGWIAKNLAVNGNVAIPFSCSDLHLSKGVYHVTVYLEDELTGSSITKTLRFIIL